MRTWTTLAIGWVLGSGCMGSRPLDLPAAPPPAASASAVHVAPAVAPAPTGARLTVAEGVRWTSVTVRCEGEASGEADVGPEDTIAVGAGCVAEAVLADGRTVALVLPAGAAAVRCDADGQCVAIDATAGAVTPEAEAPAPVEPAEAP